MEFSIRQLNENDAAPFYTLRMESLMLHPDVYITTYEEKVGASGERIETILKTNVVFGAFLGNELVGIRGISFYRKPKTHHKASLWGAYVRKQYRGNALDRLMTEDAIAHVTDTTDIEQIKAGVVEGNEASLKTLYVLGFEKYATEKNSLKHAGRYYDVHHLVKFLRD